ncbi:hypothetical protein Zm00014a_044648 [Zea mays]|uniref:Uncharacterized protein n=1 Tax=Zea mays TaxID=4577 RepID=A0A3L6GFE8_MAIZE|nr:hypothetical protein Zm00014a_044648 [Zea mays]
MGDHWIRNSLWVNARWHGHQCVSY